MRLSAKLCVVLVASFVVFSSFPAWGQVGEALTKKCAAAKLISFGDASARANQKGPVEVPPLAKQLGIKGVVRVETCVSETGEVILTKPAGGSPMLVVAALDSAKKWRFSPLIEENQAVPFKTILEISFLQGSTAAQVTKENLDNDLYFKAEDTCRKDLKEKHAERGEEDCKRALALVAKLPNERQNERGSANQLVGHALFSQRKFEESLVYYQTELEIGKASLKPSDAELGYAYHHVALALHALGRPKDAAANYELAETTLLAARQHIDTDFLKEEYSKSLRGIRENYLTLLKQTGQRDVANALEERMKRDK